MLSDLIYFLIFSFNLSYHAQNRISYEILIRVCSPTFISVYLLYLVYRNEYIINFGWLMQTCISTHLDMTI